MSNIQKGWGERTSWLPHKSGCRARQAIGTLLGTCPARAIAVPPPRPHPTWGADNTNCGSLHIFFCLVCITKNFCGLSHVIINVSIGSAPKKRTFPQFELVKLDKTFQIIQKIAVFFHIFLRSPPFHTQKEVSILESALCAWLIAASLLARGQQYEVQS